MCLHPSMSLSNEQNCRQIEDKMSVCYKTSALRCGKFSDLNSACPKMLVHVKIFQFQDMLNERGRFCVATNGLVAFFETPCITEQKL